MKKQTVLGFAASLCLMSSVTKVNAAPVEMATAPYYQYKVNSVDNTNLTHVGSFTSTTAKLYNLGGDRIGPDVMVPTTYNHDKAEHRAAWVATVANIDMMRSTSEADFKAKFQTIVDNAKDYGLNSIVFQVRPMLDAWYDSAINPSSEFIMNGGYQGQEIGFDPLEIATEMAHEAGMELHAWFNPYRVTNNTKDFRTKEEKLADLADGNFAKENPHLVYEFANKLFLDPGQPEVVNHIKATIDEVIRNYDVDAIHFDDYFYPYKTTYTPVIDRDENGTAITGANITQTMRDIDVDYATFEEHSRGFDDVHAWREDNINTLIKEVKATITEYNKESGKAVQYGISPFGIWGHADKHEGGSMTPTSSTASIDDYVDTKRWAQEGWVDYLTPQIYWAFNTTFAPYGELVSWWDAQFDGVENSHLYIGHPNYKIVENAADDFANADEIPAQLRFNKTLSNIKGSAFFSYNKLDPNTKHQSGSLAYRQSVKEEANEIVSGYYQTKALHVAKPWLDQMVTKPVQNAKGSMSEAGVTLEWKDHPHNDSQFYVVYRQEGNTVDTTNPANILEIVNKQDVNYQTYTDTTANADTKYTYAISILDYAKVESSAVTVKLNENKK